METKVTFLGTNGYPTGDKKTIGTLIESNQNKILLECGASLIQELEANGHLITDLDLILSTHIHADHSGGVPLVFFGNIMERLYKKWRSTKSHLVLALEQVTYNSFLPVIQNAYAPFFSETPPADVEILPIPNNVNYTYNPGNDLVVRTIPLRHSVPNIGIQIDWNGIKITYISDTKYFDDLCEFAKDSTLLICNVFGSLQHSEIAHRIGFMIAQDAAQIADRSRSKTLVLQHIFFPETDTVDCLKEANALFSSVIAPSKGDTINLKS